MKLSEIYKIADTFAPKRLSDEYCKTYGAYDNSGLLVEACEEVKGILFSLDLTNQAIDKAIEKGCDLIITHHPAIYGKIGNIRASDEGLLGGKLVKCIQKGISLICMHLNLDTAKGGIDESLTEGILAAAGETMGAGTSSFEIMHPLSEGGYGRVYSIPETEFGKLAEKVKAEFSAERIVTYGDEKKMIGKVANFCGGGADDETIEFAIRKQADVVISSDFKHHLIQRLVESGVAVLALTHYASEQYGFEKYYKKISQAVDIPCVYHLDESLL